MAIAPFRACRYSHPPERFREMAHRSLPGTARPSTNVLTQDSSPSLYTYELSQDGGAIRGIVALIEGNSLKQLRSPMPADPAEVAFAKECLNSKREQFAPVLALFDTYATLSAFRSQFQNPLTDGELRIAPVSDARILSELDAAIAESPLTVLAGQEWIEAAAGRPVMALLVAPCTCSTELAPRHRTVCWNLGWHAGDMVRLGREHFFFYDITRFMPPITENGPRYCKSTALEHLRPKQPGENVYLAVTARHTFRIHSLPGWADTVLAQYSPEERAVSAVQLHKILFPEGLQIPFGSSNDGRVSYTDNMDEAVARVKRGEADVAFLMNAPSIEQIMAVARIGGNLPPHTFRPRISPVPGAITYAL